MHKRRNNAEQRRFRVRRETDPQIKQPHPPAGSSAAAAASDSWYHPTTLFSGSVFSVRYTSPTATLPADAHTGSTTPGYTSFSYVTTTAYSALFGGKTAFAHGAAALASYAHPSASMRRATVPFEHIADEAQARKRRDIDIAPQLLGTPLFA